MSTKIQEGTQTSSTATRRTDFEALFRRYYGALIGFFVNRGLSRPDSEDLAQETLLKAYRGYESFRGDASEPTWLFVIAGRLWSNHRRDKGRKKRGGESAPLDVSSDPGKLIELLSGEGQRLLVDDAVMEKMLASEQRQLLRRAVHELPPQMQRCWLLYSSGQFKHREIAAILGVEVNTVKSMVHQAKSRLQVILRRNYPEFFGFEGDQP